MRPEGTLILVARLSHVDDDYDDNNDDDDEDDDYDVSECVDPHCHGIIIIITN